MRTPSSETILRSIRSCRRPGVATRMCASREALACEPIEIAAVDRRDPKVVGRGDRADLGRHLGGELACRDEDQAGRPCLGAFEPLDHRDGEGERLAGARRRLREHVAAGEGVREDEALDSEWSMDVALGERLRDARGHTQLKERLH